MNYQFDVEKVTNDCIKWIQSWFEVNGNGCNAYIGISGGVDSTVCAALLAKALGPERVFGVAMPDSRQGTNNAEDICKFLGINYQFAYIGNICDEFSKMNLKPYAEMNVPPRVRMTMLYALSQSNNGRVIMTGNLNESLVAYYTLYGDNCGDMAPMDLLTKTEVKEIGLYLGVPEEWINRIPDDGLPNSVPDEDKLGFKYDVISKYIRTGIIDDQVQVNKFFNAVKNNRFKQGLVSIPTFDPGLHISWLG